MGIPWDRIEAWVNRARGAQRAADVVGTAADLIDIPGTGALIVRDSLTLVREDVPDAMARGRARVAGHGLSPAREHDGLYDDPYDDAPGAQPYDPYREEG